MGKANENQVGGSHYKTSYEHWDLVVWTDMGYLEGCSTKYVTRWRKKDGVKDLLKALHYLNKLIESYSIITPRREQYPHRVEEEVIKFADANDLTLEEHAFIFRICVWETLEDLYWARSKLGVLIEQANNRPGTPEDGGHHER
jgi:hypothetical protein